MIYLHPIILYQSLPLPAYDEPLIRVLWLVKDWWESKGYYLGIGAIKKMPSQGIDLSAENPWAEVRWKVDYYITLGPEHKALAFLQGWNRQDAIGWGADPLALIGEYTLSRMLTQGTPEGIIDDNPAGGLIGHEIGHVLGFGHATIPAPCIMWEWWKGLSHCLAPYSTARLLSAQGTHLCPSAPKGETP